MKDTENIKKENITVNIPLLVISVLAMTAVLYLGYISLHLGLFFVKAPGDPLDAVRGFYDNVVSGNYAAAVSYVSGCDGISFEETSASPGGELLKAALKESISYNIVSAPVTNGLTSSVSVNVCHLDTKEVIEDASGLLEDILKEKVETMTVDELYDEEGGYRPDVMNDVYAEAIEQTLVNKEKYMKQETVTVVLSYKNDRWIIEYNESMIRGLNGGI